jgi:hypothetical protein
MSQLAHQLAPPRRVPRLGRRLWFVVGIVAIACVAVILFVAINRSDQGTGKVAASASQAVPYTARPDEGLGNVRAGEARYTARPDEGTAPIRVERTGTGYTARPDEGVAPIRVERAGSGYTARPDEGLGNVK